MSRVVGRGRFRVDRKKALEKLEKFRFEDPRRYVLELLAAAATSGAQRVDIVNDSDDFMVWWEGEHLAGEELDTLFDHLFGEPKGHAGVMRQHLAIGVLGAHGLQPRWLRVDSGDGEHNVRLEVSDPTETAHAPLDEAVTGIRVHVRERISAHSIAEALRLIVRDPAEAELIRGAARHYGLPVHINGRLMPRAQVPTDAVIWWKGEIGGRRAQLWLAEGADVAVDIVRHGISVGHASKRIGPFGIGGFLTGDELKLNASRSTVVKDKRHKKWITALDSAVDIMLVRGLPDATSNTAVLARLARLAIPRLMDRKVALQGWSSLAVIADIAGQRWSVERLRELDRPVGWTTLEAEVDLPEVVILEVWAEVLKRCCPGAKDLTSRVQAAASGALRRREAQLSRQQPMFPGDVEQHVVRDGSLRLAICRNQGPEKDVVVSVRLDGVPVEHLELPGPIGGVRAILDHGDLHTDLGFRHVLRDRVFDEAVARLHAEVAVFAAASLKAMCSEPGQREQALLWVSDILRRRLPTGECRDQLQGDELRPWNQLPVLATGAGERLDAVGAAAGSRETQWLVTEPADQAVGMHDVLLLPPGGPRRLWMAWLGDGAVSGNNQLLSRARARQRMKAIPEVPDLKGVAGVRRAIDHPGWNGEMVLLDRATPSASFRVLRLGHHVCDLVIRHRLEGVLGAVEVGEVEVNEMHDALASPADREVRAGLEAQLDKLALLAWDRAGPVWPPSDRVLYWLAKQPQGSIDHLGERIVATRFDGSKLTVGDLAVLRADRSKPKLVVLHKRPAVAGFGDAVPRTALLMSLLEAHAGGWFRDGAEDVEKATRLARAFSDRPPWTGFPGKSLARFEVWGEGWSGEASLSTNPKNAGQIELVALYNNRVLARLEQRSSPGVRLIVRGKAILPNAGFTNLTHPNLLRRLREEAQRLLPKALENALETRVTPHTAPALRRILSRLLAAGGRDEPSVRAVELLEAAPLFQRVDRERISLARLRELTGQGARVRLITRLGAGPTDEGVYVRSDEAIESLLTHAVKAEAGDAHLEAWRVVQRKRAAVGHMEPEVAGEVVARAPFSHDDVVGQIAVTRGEPGLRITPLVDGLPLKEAVFEAPVALAAVVEGPSIEGDARLEAVRDQRAWKRLVREIREQALALALSHAENTRGDGDWEAWTLRLAMGGGPAASWPLLPLADGRRASLDALELLAAETGRLPRIGPELAHEVERLRPSPLVLNDEVFELLDDHLGLRDLEAVLRDPLRLSPWQGLCRSDLSSPRVGQLALVSTSGPHVITLRAGRVTLASWTSDDHGLPLPIVGWIDDPDLTGDGIGGDLSQLKAGALEALRQCIRAQVHKLVDQLAERPSAEARGILRRAALALHADHSELGEALRSTPLWSGLGGQLASLRSIVDEGEYRYAAAGVHGAVPEGWRVFEPPAEGEEQIRVLVRISDVSEDLRRFRVGLARRSGPRVDPRPPSSLADRSVVVEEAGVQVVVWLGQDSQPGSLVVAVDERQVCALPVMLPGALGFLSGSFETDDAFERATIPAGAKALLETALVRLVEGAWRRVPNQTLHRIRVALAGRPLKQLFAEAPWWGEVALLRRQDGRPLSLQEVAQLSRNKRVVWARAGDGDLSAAMVVVEGAAGQELMELCLPPKKLVRLDTLLREQRDAALEREVRSHEREQSRRKKLIFNRTLRYRPSKLSKKAARAGAGRAVRELGDVPAGAPGELLQAWMALAMALDEADDPQREVDIIKRLATDWPR